MADLYNSSHTGAEIDQAVSDVRDNKQAWNDKLAKTGDGSNVTAAFTKASSRTNIATGEKLSVLFGKIAKWLGSLAFKSTVAKSDLASDVQTSLGKADTAITVTVTAADNGKFLRVVNGAWAAATVDNANGASF